MSALATMLPQLEAEELLSLSTAVALGSGTLPRSSAQRIHADLVRVAGGRARRAGTPTERLAAAAALGIAVVQS